MDYAAKMEVLTDTTLAEDEVRFGYPPRYIVRANPRGETFRFSQEQTADGYKVRLDWMPNNLGITRIR